MSLAVIGMHAHRLLRRTLRVNTFAILATIANTSLLQAQTKPRCTAYPTVDLRSASVAGLALDTTISSIRRAIGSANIRRYMVDSEEGRVPAYSLRICGHVIDRYQEGVSWTDPAYRSSEGLGVGSTLSAFDSAFGVGKISADHGLQVRYDLDRYQLYVDVVLDEVGNDCYTSEPPAPSTVDRGCRVTMIGLDLTNRP